MSTPLVPPTPRSLIIGYVGGPRGTPVFADRVWADYWVKQIYERLGGANGPSVSDLASDVDALDVEVGSVRAVANHAAISARAPAEVSVPLDLLNSLLSRVAALERKVLRIEESPL